MNKIYKIVWSKIRNTWVVASEIAKGHGKSSSSEGNGKLLKSLVLTALLGSFMTAGMSPVAATLTPEQQAVYNAVLKELENKGVHYVSVKGESQDNKSNYKNDGAKGKGAVAIGENALAAKGGTVSIGRNAHIEGNGGNTSGEGSVAIGDNSLITTNGLDLASIAIGKNAKVLNGSGKQERVLSFMPDNYTNGDLPDNADKSAGGIAIGTNSYARTGSIQLGHHTFAGYKMGGIDVTKANEEANIVGMTTVGTNTYNKGALANMYGAYSIITGSFTGAGGFNSLSYGSQNFGANVVGSLNSIRSKGHSGSSGIANSIVGVANTVENANGTLVYGAGNKVTNSIASIGAPSTFLGSPTWDKMVESLQKGIKDSKSGGAVLAIGGGNVADYVRHSQLVGVNNTVTGTENKVSEFNMVNGYQNTATNITHVTMIGSENQVTDTKNALVFGDKRKLTKANGSVVIGVSDTVKEIKVEDVTVIGHNALAEGANAVAIGRGASADSLSTVAIGDEARVSSDTNLSGGVAIGKKSNVINGNGRQEKYLGFGTLNDPQRSATGIAIGAYSLARTGSIQIGAHTYLGKMGGIEVTDGTNWEANHVNQTTVGTNTFNKGIFGTMIGAYSISTGDFTGGGRLNSLTAPQNFGSTVIGSLNTIQSKAHGNEAGIANSIVGLANVTENTNGTLIFGAGNKVTNSKKYISAGNLTSGAATPDELIEKLRKMTIDSESGGSTMVIGGGNTADYTRASQIMGVNNILTGTEDKVSTYNLVDGFINKAEHVTHLTMIGSENEVKETTGAVLLGDKRKLTGADGSIVLGSADDSVETNVKDATVIGHNANTTVASGVALGSDSVANREKADAEKVYLHEDAGVKATVKGDLAAVSVGNADATRQITGVAAGTEDTDAVNVAQLKAVESKITQAGAETQKHTSVTEGTNISVTEDGTNNEGGKNYKVSLAKDIDLGQDGSIKAGNTIINKDGVTTNTVKAGDTTINNDGLTIEGGPVITKTNVDVNNQQIHHVKDGTADDDAATVGQVNKKIDEITKTVTGSSVTGGTIGEDGKISLTKADKTTVELQGQLKDISARAGDYEIKDNKVTIGLEDNYSKNAAGNIVIKDVAKASALEQETKERKDADKVITETIGAANKDELKTAYQDTTYIKNSTTLVEADKALDKAIGKNAGDIKKNTETINILGKQVGNLDTRVNKVGAGAAALAALHPLDFDPDDKWDFAAGYGNYKGANAAAIGAYYRPNEDTMFSVGGSFGGGENMVNAGISVKLGQGNHVSTSKVAMAKDMLAMQKRMAEMEAQMAKMQGFIGALTGVDTQTAMFPDVPENHWAYEYVKGLCEKGIIEGYPDGNFNGNRSMTRYEFAAMLYRALAKGVNLDARAVKEFAPELGRIRVDVISQNKEGQPVIERVRVNEEKKEK